MAEAERQHEHDPHAVLRRFHLTLDDAQRHVMSPGHLHDVRELIETPIIRFPRRSLFDDLFSVLYTLNVDELGLRLHDALSPCLMGYALALRRSGKTILAQQWRWARSYADTLSGWSTATPMHVASVSKLVTAIAMVKLLREHGISVDAPIDPWLPRYWQRGSNVRNLRFRHLLTHTSGLFAAVHPGATGPCDFPSMQAAIADGTTDLVSRDYKNVNFSLCRILIATINGDVDPSYLDSPVPPGATFLFGLRDPLWDMLTIRAYTQYVNDRIFAPADVAARAFAHTDDAALAYGPSPDGDKGWNSGDKQAASATVGWHLSVKELLRVMATFRRSGKIVGTASAQTMLDDGFGIDWSRNTLIGKMYCKGGWWEGNGKVEQSSVYFLPRRTELVVLANSPSCSPNTSVVSRVVDAIESSIELRGLHILRR